jgi:hypothetical protein
MMQIIMIITATMVVQVFAGLSLAQSSSRWDVSPPAATIAGEKEPSEVIQEMPPAAAAPAPQPARPAYAAPSPKSDLPEGWEKPKEVPQGAVRLEDVKPGVTKPKPQQLDAPAGISGPAPRPAPAAPSAPVSAAPSGGAKSDLPAGWEKPAEIPEGAVRLEDVKAGAAKPKAAEPAAEPAAKKKAQPAKPEPQAAAVPEEAEDKALWDSRSRPAIPLHQVETGPAPVTTAAPWPPPAGRAPETRGTEKSDLPPGWEQPAAVPPGAVRLEDVKPGTRPAVEAGAAAPAEEKSAPAKETAIKEKDVTPSREGEGTRQETRQRWGM